MSTRHIFRYLTALANKSFPAFAILQPTAMKAGLRLGQNPVNDPEKIWHPIAKAIERYEPSNQRTTYGNDCANNLSQLTLAQNHS